MTVVESIVGSAAGVIGRQLLQGAVFLCCVRGQFEWIQRELNRINRYLKHADAKAREGKTNSMSIQGWVVEVMGVADDADDAITFFVWMEEQRKSRTPIQKCWFFCCDLLNLLKAGVLIRAVKKNIEEISTSRSSLGLNEIVEGEGHEASSSSLSPRQRHREAPLYFDFETQIFVGFEREMDELRNKLIRGDARRRVVSIFGMGGGGKTTLASKLYNDSDVKAHFGSNVARVSVSRTYNVKELLQKIAEQVMLLQKENFAKLNEGELKEKLRESLKDHKYLIFVDDVWDIEAWNELEDAFPDGNKGSRILLTTRDEVVAKLADRLSKPHDLRLLTEEESWALFLKIVFPPREQNGEPICPPDLEHIARQMVEKCKGLPLAIKVLGGLSFTTSDNPIKWSTMLSQLKLQMAREPKHFNDVLELSYLDLPDYLKPCFLYLGIFPEDYQIPLEELTRLWIAEGFIQATGQSSEEDVAKQYVEKLMKRSIIQVIFKRTTKNDFSVNKYCLVHDKLRDLAIEEAKRVSLFEIDDNRQLFENISTSISALNRVRRLGIHHSSSEDNSHVWRDRSCCNPPKVRSLFCFADRGLQQQGLRHAKWLRVLHLEEDVSILVKGDVIRELVHLKYLRMRGVERLPSSIDKLYNLQTLDLGWTAVRLPTAIWSLLRLRHLIAYKASFDGHPQPQILKHLHTLELAAGEWLEENNLIRLSKLRNLCIVKADLEKFGEALINAIQQMVHLQMLQLKTTTERGVLLPFKPFNNNSQLKEIILTDVKILQEQPQISFEFPPMLTRLVLTKTYLKHDPMPTLGKLKNLRSLIFGINAYVNKELTMPEQGFPKLQNIAFVSLFNLEEWIMEKEAMPILEQLQVHDCDKLKMLPEGLQDITTPKKLIIRMPIEFCQRLKENGGEDWHKIQHVPSVTLLGNA